MRYLVLACDYDGTLARDGLVEEATLAHLCGIEKPDARLYWSAVARSKTCAAPVRLLKSSTALWQRTAGFFTRQSRRRNSCFGAV